MFRARGVTLVRPGIEQVYVRRRGKLRMKPAGLVNERGIARRERHKMQAGAVDYVVCELCQVSA
jgi:hypothetical protein